MARRPKARTAKTLALAALLAGAIALQGFQPVSRRRAQIGQHVGVVDRLHLSLRRREQVRRKALDRPAGDDGFRELTLQRNDHLRTVSAVDTLRNCALLAHHRIHSPLLTCMCNLTFAEGMNSS